MGFSDFFNSIKTGLGSAVDWVNRNSGTIGTVAGVIGKVAAGILVTEDLDGEADGKDEVLHLQRNYNAATLWIEKQADAVAKKQLSTLATDPAVPTQTNSAKLTGVWTLPSFNDPSGNPAVTIAQDVSKFLGQQCIPTVYKTTSGKMVDVAQYVAEAAFGNEPSRKAAADDNGVITFPIDIQVQGDGFHLMGAHSYYELPLGQPLGDIALHSCLSIHSVTSQEFRARHTEFRKTLMIHEIEVAEVAAAGGWKTTFRIAWTAIQLAHEVWPKVAEILKNSKNTKAQAARNAYEIPYSTDTGNYQIVQLTAPSGVTPAATKSDLMNAVSKAIQDFTIPPKHQGSLTNLSMQLPTIDIESTSIVLPSSMMTQLATAQQGNAQQNGVSNSQPTGPADIPGRGIASRPGAQRV